MIFSDFQRFKCINFEHSSQHFDTQALRFKRHEDEICILFLGYIIKSEFERYYKIPVDITMYIIMGWPRKSSILKQNDRKWKFRCHVPFIFPLVDSLAWCWSLKPISNLEVQSKSLKRHTSWEQIKMSNDSNKSFFMVVETSIFTAHLYVWLDILFSLFII